MRQTLFILSLQQGLKQKKAQTNENGLKTIVIGNTIVVRRARYVYARPPLIEGFLKRNAFNKLKAFLKGAPFN